MNDNVIIFLNSYCENEIKRMKASSLYYHLQNLLNKNNLILVCEYGTGQFNRKSTDWYLSITVLNAKNEMIEIPDDGVLTAATKLIFIDKKERVKFFSWEDEDFIESINWIMQSVENLAK